MFIGIISVRSDGIFIMRYSVQCISGRWRMKSAGKRSWLLMNGGDLSASCEDCRAVSRNIQYGTRFRVFGAYSWRLMERRRTYAVKVTPRGCSGPVRILSKT
jgi:hypothetical protein